MAKYILAKEPNPEYANLSKPQREEKAYKISLDIADMKRQKKSTVRGFNEELKRLDSELKEIMQPDLQMHEVL